MKVAEIQSYYLAPDVINYLVYLSEKLKMSRSGIVEMIVRYVASQDQEFIGDRNENSVTNIDNIV